MTFAICDDDPLFCKQLEQYVNEYIKEHKIKDVSLFTYHSGEELLAQSISFDIVFLDVEMTGVSGIHTGRKLKEQNPKVIFIIITSYNDYLDEALRFHAFRYLSKPLDKDRLFRNIKDALYVYNTNVQKMIIETKEDNYTVYTSDIIMIEALGRKVIVRTTSDDYLSIHNMNYWKEKLDENQFFQPHRSYIINFKHVNHFDHRMIYLFNERYRSYLTYRKYTEFKDRYLMYLDSVN